jgi:hypothetical protein
MPLYGGVLGDAMSDAANAYLKAVVDAPKEREEQRKRVLENERLESLAQLDRARAAYEERRLSGTGRPVYVKTKQGVLERNPDTGEWSVAYEAPASSERGKPDEVIKWQAIRGLEELFKKPHTAFGSDEFNSDNPLARGLWDAYYGRSDLQPVGKDQTIFSKSQIRGAPSGTPVQPSGAPAETPPVQSPAAAPAPSPAPAPRTPARTTQAPTQTGQGAIKVWADNYGAMSDAELVEAEKVLAQMPHSPITTSQRTALEQVKKARLTGTPVQSRADRPPDMRVASGPSGTVSDATPSGGPGVGPAPRTGTVPTQPSGQPRGTGTASSPGGFRPPKTPEQMLADEFKIRDQAMQEGKDDREAQRLVLAYREDQRQAHEDSRAAVRLAIDKDRLVIAKEAHAAQEADRQRAIQEHKEGGMPTKDQATWANHLYVLGKVDHPYYTELDTAQKKLVDDTVRIPKDADEARKAADDLRAGKADIRADQEAARQREKDRLGGGVNKDQEMTSNSLFVTGKVKSQFYDELDAKDRELVNRTIKQPDVDRAYREQARLLMSQRKEVRDALKLAQPHLDELRALDTTRHLTEMIVPLLSTGNIGMMGKLKSLTGSALQYSPLAKGQFRKDAERQLLAEAKAQGKDKELTRVIDENAIQARILANVEDDQGQAQRLTGLSAQSRLETLSSILVYAHAMATKRGAGGTTRGLIKTDIDKAEKLFNPELWTKDPDQLLRNLQALQEFIQHARPIIRETVQSYGIDPDTRRYIGTPTLESPGTVTLTPEQLKLLQPAAPRK